MGHGRWYVFVSFTSQHVCIFVTISDEREVRTGEALHTNRTIESHTTTDGGNIILHNGASSRRPFPEPVSLAEHKRLQWMKERSTVPIYFNVQCGTTYWTTLNIFQAIKIIVTIFVYRQMTRWRLKYHRVPVCQVGLHSITGLRYPRNNWST